MSEREPWFVGDKVMLPVSPVEWIILLLVGEYALVGNIYQPGGNVRMVATSLLTRDPRQVKAVAGRIYRRDKAVGIGLEDGRVFIYATGPETFDPSLHREGHDRYAILKTERAG